ncbi:MAG: ABC transporter ATP-binding protein [Erysipelotrichaceae bacterium]|nr:ABC transporter ATP-binding protein [Erysipelotrichaceae bacterium]
MSFVDLNNICVSYDGKTNILEGLNLSIEKGELVSLLGPSGCGKTTTLRVVAGYIDPRGGELMVDGEDFTKIAVHKRNFGIVFQSYALFPHLSVKDNVAFGLKMRKMDKAQIDRKVDDMLAICGLSEYKDRLPRQMSGGQRQRVALARALVIEPKLLLLDEPLSNLDAKLRIQMRVEIKRLQKQLGITTIFVTHDQEECFSISDRVAVMNQGVIEQYDTPEHIYTNPKTEFVARFIGFENFISATKQADHIYQAGDTRFHVDALHEGNDVKMTIRPDDIRIVTEAGDNCIEGTVIVRTFLGKSYQYEMKTPLGTLVVNGDGTTVYETGDTCKLCLPSHKIVLV